MHNYTENQKTNFTIFSYFHNFILTSQLKKKKSPSQLHVLNICHTRKRGLINKNVYNIIRKPTVHVMTFDFYIIFYIVITYKLLLRKQ